MVLIKMKKCKYVKLITQEQLDLCHSVGLDVKGCTISVAKARLDDFIEKGFYGTISPWKATSKQIDYANKFGYDISKMARRESEAIINDLMEELNHEAIRKENLEPGVHVRNIHDPSDEVCIISSITDNGTVYLSTAA